MRASHAAARRSAAVPMLGVNRQRRKCSHCCQAKSESDCHFHVSDYLPYLGTLSGTEHLANVETQIEAKAVDIKSRAARVAGFHPPELRRLKRYPGIEPVLAGEAAGAADDPRRIEWGTLTCPRSRGTLLG